MAKTKKTEAAKSSDAIKAFKGFDKNMQCRGFQFEIGKTYKHEGAASLCHSGFHACEAPLHVLNYYPPLDGNQYAEVELSGLDEKTEADSKRAGTSISIKVSITIPMLILAQIDWTFSKADHKDTAASGGSSNLAASGYYSNLAASGYSSKLAASGYSSNLAASGDYSKLAASGYSSNLAASGYSSNLAASGDSSKLAASGGSSNLAASGGSSKLAASGDSSKLAASGDYSKLAASGGSSKLAASGYSSNLAASGYSSKLAASGYSSKLAASGDYSKLAASGGYSKLGITGKNGCAVSSAENCKARASEGGAIALRWTDKSGRPRITVGYVGESGIKADTWYQCDKSGTLVEAE